MVALPASEPSVTFTLPSLEATNRLGAAIARTLVPGDCLLLSGDLGAGKTALARAVITEALEIPEDIPSPTFTLVQMYDAANFELWHCDLYRLASTDELVELGLEDAFLEAVSLIEWPDRLGSLIPPNAQHLSLQAIDETTRSLSVSGDERWRDLPGAVLE